MYESQDSNHVMFSVAGVRDTESRKNGKKENTDFSYSGPEEQTGERYLQCLICISSQEDLNSNTFAYIS